MFYSHAQNRDQFPGLGMPEELSVSLSERLSPCNTINAAPDACRKVCPQSQQLKHWALITPARPRFQRGTFEPKRNFRFQDGGCDDECPEWGA